MALVFQKNVLKSDIFAFQKILKNQLFNLHPLNLYHWKAMKIHGATAIGPRKISFISRDS